ncbi:testis-expressed protein 36-like isoform X2 [Tubulanus polymorphus]|uniref:testis-expressed protein 36-like isoform X2 n=1 Tax=Tubulanus polymorphus TaxID=672921 RepID=UPI003DA5C0A2
MPKGRSFAPDTHGDGVWFHHRGLTDPGPLRREKDTTQGLMFTTPYMTEYKRVPFPPPAPYLQKESRNYKRDNPFSMHNNRHSLQDHGVYFGNGKDTRFYGKTVMAPERQHKSDKEFLLHSGRHIYAYDYRSSYRSNFLGDKCEEPPVYRRFPQHHKEGESGIASLATQTTSAFDADDTHRTPLQVLASSQEPFLKTNKWKYSYHGLPRIYPSYDLKNHPNHLKSKATQQKTCLF